jgi:putative colanic acid biosynthesis acetyltransferase WcaF
MNVPRRSLAGFTAAGYEKGRSGAWQIGWLLVSGLLTSRWWCPLPVRLAVLRAFGAEIGSGVVIRHNVRIHWPWKLVVGDNSWIGEDVWILNLEPVSIGSDVCISQGVLLCTGSHDRNSPTFEFDNAPISVGDGSWIAARATVLRGVTIGDDCMIGATTLIVKNLQDGLAVLAPVLPATAALGLQARSS